MSSYIAPSAPSNPLSLKASYSAPSDFKNRKAPAAIDIWRHEVSSCCHPPPPPPTHTQSLPISSNKASTTLTESIISESQSSSSLPKIADGMIHSNSLQRRPSFLKRLLVEQPKKSLAALRGKRSGEDLNSGEGNGNGKGEVKTEMYDLSALRLRAKDVDGEGIGKKEVNENGNGEEEEEEEEDDDGRSMEIETSGSDSSQEICSIKERRARLERAERLLRGRR